MTDEVSSARVSAATGFPTPSWRPWIPSARIPRKVIYVKLDDWIDDGLHGGNEPHN